MVEKNFILEHYSYEELNEKMTVEELYEAKRKLERMIRNFEDELNYVEAAFKVKRTQGY